MCISMVGFHPPVVVLLLSSSSCSFQQGTLSCQEIIRYFVFEVAFKSHLVQPPAMSRDIINWICLIRALSNTTLNISRDESPIISLSNLFQSCNTLIVNKFFLIYSLNPFCSSLKPFFPVLSLKELLKNLPLSKFL